MGDLESNEQPKWSAFEERVGTLYRALGYRVTRDHLNRGSQIDLIAEKRDPVIGRVRIGVEVKDHPGASLPIDEVRQFLAAGANAIRKADFDKVHLVTSARITKNGRAEAADEQHMRLMTYDELERELFNPDPTLERWLQQYRRAPISRRFVEVMASPLELQDGTGGWKIPSTGLLDVALASPSSAVVVLADYGSGKSTMLERIKAMAIERRARQPSEPVPVLIRLRDLKADFDIEKVVVDAMRSEVGETVQPEYFWALLASGRLLMLLDGFDEMTLRTSEATRERLLGALSPLLFGRSPAILTSRPSYFASLGEYRAMLARMTAGRPRPTPGASDERRIEDLVGHLVERYRDTGPTAPVAGTVDTFTLDRLESSQIDRYLELAARDLATAGTTPQEVREFLDGVYDLSDLISRPIILDMTVESTVRGVIKPGQKTLEDGPAGLYEAYAQVRLERDWGNVESRQEVLTHDERMRFAEECAVHMDQQGRLRLESDQIADVVHKTRHIGPDDDLEAILTDLRTCSFLTVDEDGALEFIHRSYQEFFFARRLKSDLLRKSTARLGVPLLWEYAYFLGSMGYTSPDLYQVFTELARSPDSSDSGTALVVGDNAAQALLVAREVARDLDWRYRAVRELRRPRTQIVGSVLRDVDLMGLDLGQLDLTDSTLGVRIGCEEVGELTLTNCTGKVTIDGLIDRITADGGDLTVRCSSTVPLRTSFDSMTARVRAEGTGDHTFRQVSGRAEVGEGTVAIDRCELTFDCSGLVEGAVSDSLVDIEIAGWGQLATEISRTVVVVHGSRPAWSMATATHRARQVVDASPSGRDAVVVVDPSVSVDRWWSRQAGLVTFGARIPEDTTHMPGLFVHEVDPPPRGTNTGDLAFRWTGQTVVMLGRGPIYKTVCDRLSLAVSKATARTVANGTWFSMRLSSVLSEHGCPAPAITELAGLLEGVADAGPTPSS